MEVLIGIWGLLMLGWLIFMLWMCSSSHSNNDTEHKNVPPLIDNNTTNIATTIQTTNLTSSITNSML